MTHSFQRGLIAGVSAFGLMAGMAQADQQILDDLIVGGSICAGTDCSNGESFGFDTIRLKENNLRIRAMDTSNSASFPPACCHSSSCAALSRAFGLVTSVPAASSL